MAETIANGLVEVAQPEAALLMEAGQIYLEMRDWKAAQAIFSGAATMFPKSEAPQLALGQLEFAQGHHEKALQAYRAAQRIAPRSGVARAYCGEALLWLGKVAEAEKELKAAIDLEGDGDAGDFARALLEAKAEGALPPPKAAKKAPAKK